MRHNVFGKKLSRSTTERRRLFSGLVRDLVLHSSLVTSLAKAKAVTGFVDQLITLAKKGEKKRPELEARLMDARTVKKLLEDAKGRFSARTSGYVRLTRLARRFGDGSEQVVMSFVDSPVALASITSAPVAKDSAKQGKPVVARRGRPSKK